MKLYAKLVVMVVVFACAARVIVVDRADARYAAAARRLESASAAIYSHVGEREPADVVAAREAELQAARIAFAKAAEELHRVRP